MNQLSRVVHRVQALLASARRALPGRLLVLAVLSALSSNGCTSMTNPVGDAFPVRRLPEELFAESREAKKTIPLTMLRQPPSDVYRLAPGDVVGVYIEGILPSTVLGQTPPIPPVYFPAQINLGRNLPPAVGFPFPVRDDGTVALPQLDPIPVRDKTIVEAQDIITEAYLKKGILPPGKERIIVTLMQGRKYRVMVFRQEAGGFTSAGAGGLIASSSKRNTGNYVDLPAYENDVLSALSQTGGLPGLDTFNEVIIFKGGLNPAALQEMQNLPPGKSPLALADGAQRVVRIPLRRRPDDLQFIPPEDIILNNGDVVFLEARDADLFYTGGLLPVGEYVLPRDYDLDVIKAIGLVKGPLLNGAFGTNGLAGNLIEPGIGNPSPSMLIVIRKTGPCGQGQVPILVDLNRALRDPRERIYVKAGDVLILQERPSESFTRYFTRTFMNFSLTWQAIHDKFITGTVDVTAPERVGNRINVTQ